ncbi:MAG: L-histidine N(alpha)-methyltransferase [Myxococcota bacterium]|nr:L-histidine N(alpha)-methyltransferase [Myxococcota bacterium]
MDDPGSPHDLHDFAPEREAFLAEVLRGLRQPRKELPCKYLYDAQGSVLFDRICELEEYYPTRTELAIMDADADAMSAALGPRCLLVEYGSGSSAKTHVLLEHLVDPAACVPVDISRDHLLRAAEELAKAHRHIPIIPVCADFTRPFAVPEPPRPERRRAVYFPGSTIGNFTPAAARALLRSIREVAGDGGGLLIGVDLVKDPAVLERAYDDARGVTAAFNKNLLARINRELGGDFDLDAFAHRAVWNEEAGRVEMHLVSRRTQTARVDGEAVGFVAGESICTEHSHKYTLEGFARLAAEAGFRVESVWTDPEDLFSVQWLVSA